MYVSLSHKWSSVWFDGGACCNGGGAARDVVAIVLLKGRSARQAKLAHEALNYAEEIVSIVPVVYNQVVHSICVGGGRGEEEFSNEITKKKGVLVCLSMVRTALLLLLRLAVLFIGT